MDSYFDLIILAALAGFLGFRLFSVLGKYNNPSKKPTTEAKNLQEPRFSSWQAPTGAAKSSDNAEGYLDSLKKLQISDSQFTESSFLKGAQVAFETLFTARRDADQKTIKSLCGPELQQYYHDQFASQRSRQWISKDELLRILYVRLQDIYLGSKMAKITVEFKSEQVMETRDEKNRLVEGDPDQIEIIKETWTFSRTTVSKDPNWQLVDVT